MSNYANLLEWLEGFDNLLKGIKAQAIIDFAWYPYETVGGFRHLAPIIPASIDYLFDGNRDIADIGAADGSVSFFLESLGNRCDIYDFENTNYNKLKGARYIKEHTNSKVNIYNVDLDSQFSITKKYDLVFFLGILYHLKNPYYILEQLATKTRYLCFSTRIARYPYAGGSDMSSTPVAYLLSPHECNNDATNYWIFTESSLKRIFDRTGWKILSFRTVGDTVHSNPQDDANREGAWAVLESNVFHG